MTVGFIKLHRRLLNWEWYKDSPTKDLFIHFLLNANYGPGSCRGIELQRGQLLTTARELSEETGLSRQQIRTATKKLLKTQEINQTINQKLTIVTVLNYDSYQGLEYNGNQTGNQMSTTNQPEVQPDINQPIIKENNNIINNSLYGADGELEIRNEELEINGNTGEGDNALSCRSGLRRSQEGIPEVPDCGFLKEKCLLRKAIAKWKFESDFAEFWKTYPTRNGVKVGKAEAKKKYATIKTADRGLVLQAVKKLAESGQMPKDAHRFLKNDNWREWGEQVVDGHGRTRTDTDGGIRDEKTIWDKVAAS